MPADLPAIVLAVELAAAARTREQRVAVLRLIHALDVTESKQGALFDYAPILSHSPGQFHERNGGKWGRSGLVMTGMEVVSKRNESTFPG
jgi:hypothetical protein